ncbi:MAG: protein translocase subunit SecD [Alphaproteobacteria bacterium]
MLNFPPWKIWLVLATCLVGAVLAFPNLVDEDRLESLPDWLPANQINLGLDLQGGQHLLLEVDITETLARDVEDLRERVPAVLRQVRTFGRAAVVDDAVVVTMRDPGDTDTARRAFEDELSRTINTNLGPQSNLEVNVQRPGVIDLRFSEQAISQRTNEVMSKTLEVIRKRVDELGTREPSIQRQGQDRVLVQIPGGGFDISVLQEQAKLTFHLVDDTTSITELDRGRVRAGFEILYQQPEIEGGRAIPVAIQKRIMVDGADLTDAQPGFDPNTGQPIVSITFNQTGAKAFADATLKNVGRPFAIVLDDEVISAPVIREAILGGQAQISGGFSVTETTQLSLLLRAGALPASVGVIEERTVGPDLGADSIEAGRIAAIIGLIAVIVFMVLCYGGFGVAANVSLLANLILIAGVLSLLQATLTLPGIAGIVLTIGMAVDANVLVFERIREEIRSGKGPVAAVETGYSKAMSTILDANITTLIAAVLLFIFGTGPIRGFAVTLSVGIVTSVFTAVILTRMMLAIWLRRRRPATIEV